MFLPDLKVNVSDCVSTFTVSFAASVKERDKSAVLFTIYCLARIISPEVEFISKKPLSLPAET